MNLSVIDFEKTHTLKIICRCMLNGVWHAPLKLTTNSYLIIHEVYRKLHGKQHYVFKI